MKNYVLYLISAFLLVNTVNAALPSAYVTPGANDIIGITTVIDNPQQRVVPVDFDLSFQDTSGYGHSFEYNMKAVTDNRFRLVITQYPVNKENLYPVEIKTTGPNTFSVNPVTFVRSATKGPKGFDSAALFIGPWLSSFKARLNYTGNGSNPERYLVYSYPDTQNNNATQNYSRTETITLGINASLSAAPDKNTIGGNASFSSGVTYGGSVSTAQMMVEKTNDTSAGNQWNYTTSIDSFGTNIVKPYDIFNYGGNISENNIPSIAKNFTPTLGQFWKFPKGVSQEFGYEFKPAYSAASGVEHWVWGFYLGPEKNDAAYKRKNLIYSGSIKLDPNHPAIAGLNTFRFRYGNSGKCWVEDRYSNMFVGFKMQDCNTQIASQYLLQTNESYMKTVGSPNPAIPNYLSLNYSTPNSSSNPNTATDWVYLLGVALHLDNGNVECASYNSKDCLWGTPVANLDKSKLKPLTCGEPHLRVWGSDGYSTPSHWCARGLKLLATAQKNNSPTAIDAKNTAWIDYQGVAVRLYNGDVQCASYNDRDCLWGTQSSAIDTPKLNPLTCGAGHLRAWGTDGYSSPNHWCATALTYLKNIASKTAAANATTSANSTVKKWFQDDQVYNWLYLTIFNDNIACYSVDGSTCSKSAPTKEPSKDNLLVCGKNHKEKHNSNGYAMPGYWCSIAAAKYLPASIVGESGDFYSKFYFTDNGNIKTNQGDFLVDVEGDAPIVRDVRTTGIRDGLWQYLVFNI